MSYRVVYRVAGIHKSELVSLSFSMHQVNLFNQLCCVLFCYLGTH